VAELLFMDEAGLDLVDRQCVCDSTL